MPFAIRKYCHSYWVITPLKTNISLVFRDHFKRKIIWTNHQCSVRYSFVSGVMKPAHLPFHKAIDSHWNHCWQAGPFQSQVIICRGPMSLHWFRSFITPLTQEWPCRSLTVRPWKVTFPIGKDRRPTIIFKGLSWISGWVRPFSPYRHSIFDKRSACWGAWTSHSSSSTAHGWVLVCCFEAPHVWMRGGRDGGSKKSGQEVIISPHVVVLGVYIYIYMVDEILPWFFVGIIS